MYIPNKNGQNQYFIHGQKGQKDTPFGAANTSIAHVMEFSTGPRSQ